jgi:hypothetical protein
MSSVTMLVVARWPARVACTGRVRLCSSAICVLPRLVRESPPQADAQAAPGHTLRGVAIVQRRTRVRVVPPAANLRAPLVPAALIANRTTTSEQIS